MSARRILIISLIPMLGILAISCNKKSMSLTDPVTTNLYSPKPANLRVSLTDAPNDQIKSVFVNIDHVEILMHGRGKQGRLILGKGMGMVNLMSLQNGLLLPIADANIPQGIRASQIRLILAPEGHYIEKDDASICNLKTPSQERTGIKILIKQSIEFENDYAYSLVVDFDANKSIVLQGNNGCLLKPVLKLKSASRIPSDEVSEDGSINDDGLNEDGSNSSGEEQLSDGSDGNDESGDGFADDESSSLGDEISEEDLSALL